MSKTKIVLNSKGITDLLKSQEIQTFLQEKAQDIVSRCSGAYETDVYVGKNRANSSIITRDAATFRKNLKDNELLRALK